MKKSTLAALSLFALSAFAQTKLDLPYYPSADFEDEVLTSNSWLEIYSVEPSNVSAAIKSLVDLQGAPPALAVGLPSGLRVLQDKEELALKTTAFSLSRGTEEVRYDTQCVTLPKRGDTLTAVYADDSSGVTITVQASYRAQYAFKETALVDGSIRLDPLEQLGPDTCLLMAQNRLLYQGTLSVKKAGDKTTEYSVLLQVIQLMPEATGAVPEQQ